MHDENLQVPLSHLGRNGDKPDSTGPFGAQPTPGICSNGIPVPMETFGPEGLRFDRFDHRDT